ncbi:MAG: tat (twin-arginine translocation) pathway signal sequence [Deltaproteobacteria bacterium HGW-Deltaproteobacteria-6]|jgi:uncharacterized protein (DUF362 family)|nr:MAG: tat (twin-arginine translocation) pathway signal sequence [Deltaproteobacteria bacterium HGW-Deltaproteobacteria-6]
MGELLKTDRRGFLKQGIALGVAAGSSVILGKTDSIWAKDVTPNSPDLVAVKNGQPDTLFKKAISLMGGMGQFVKKGQTVVVKPNIGFAGRPEMCATTNPLLVRTVVEHCLAAGARKVYVFDNATMAGSAAENCYRISGIEEAARKGGATVVPGNEEKYYKEVKIPGGKVLKSAKVHELLLSSDVFINVPILKSHSYAHLTAGMKNLMGVVWDRMTYHMSGLDQCIADFCLYRKPDLNIVDAYRVLMKNGPSPPRSESAAARDIELKKTLLISRDIVTVDAAAAKIFGSDPERIRYIRTGHEQRIGNMHLDKLKIATHAM